MTEQELLSLERPSLKKVGSHIAKGERRNIQLFLRHIVHVQQQCSDNSSASLYCTGAWAALSPLIQNTREDQSPVEISVEEIRKHQQSRYQQLGRSRDHQPKSAKKVPR